MQFFNFIVILPAIVGCASAIPAADPAVTSVGDLVARQNCNSIGRCDKNNCNPSYGPDPFNTIGVCQSGNYKGCQCNKCNGQTDSCTKNGCSGSRGVCQAGKYQGCQCT
ncbi:hypothetical protein BS50DRAFT_592520 [Corynespora cassiicola Philippines]|uniref:EGF-like domain-containing protein n=1 Tax=Corynespora cassiicola Philippines TaxID=1448308 RepID=A0A2T2NA46_CORCC|nr:hypothetical protein BS50DRAFT_592520 [Corynespora cassiicola Philippines]